MCSSRRQKKTFKCPQCEKICKKSDALQAHLAKAHPEICSICGDKFQYRQHLNVHMMSVHKKVKGLSCHMCNYRCYYKHHLVNHLKTNHPNKKGKCKCLYCEHSFSTRASTNRHIKRYILK
jgi:transcription elongation factor Elf1